MPRDLKLELDEIAISISSLSEEKEPEDVLIGAKSYISKLRSSTKLKQYIENCLSSAPLSFYELLYHKAYSSGVHEIVNEWENDPRAMKSPTPASGYKTTVEWMQEQLAGYKEQTSIEQTIHMSDSYGFYFEGRSHDLLYGPQKGSLSWNLLAVLRENFMQKPLSASGIVKKMGLTNSTMSNDVISSISDINKAFTKASNQEQGIILNKHGYFLNDRSFEIKLD